MDEILITGGRVVLRSVQELKSVRVDDFFQSLATSAGTRTPILPHGVIYYAASSEIRLYATHRQPGNADIQVRSSDDDSIRGYRLSLPHVYFFHRYFNSALDALYAFCSPATVDDPADMLYKLPLKNIHGDGSVCIGDDLKFSVAGCLCDKIAMTENFFWESVFNSDLDSCFNEALPDEFKCKNGGEPLEVWEELSGDSGFDPCKVKWKPYQKWSQVVDDLVEG